jgi:hypothetical protein
MDRIKLARKNLSCSSLFLQGVFKRECRNMEDIFQERLMCEDMDRNTQDMIIYDKIPLRFTTREAWPHHTNLLCWYCNRAFKTVPWFEPQSIEPISDGVTGKILNHDEVVQAINKKSFSIMAHGNFCSKNCVRAYIDKNTTTLADKINKVNMLKFVCELLTDEIVKDILPSPDPLNMVQYGGNVLPNEYQKSIDALNVSYNSKDPDKITAFYNCYIQQFES